MPVIRIRDIDVEYDLPTWHGRFSTWWSRHGVELWFVLVQMLGLVLFAQLMIRLFQG